jgi:hypothetical protein
MTFSLGTSKNMIFRKTPAHNLKRPFPFSNSENGNMETSSEQWKQNGNRMETGKKGGQVDSIYILFPYFHLNSPLKIISDLWGNRVLNTIKNPLKTPYIEKSITRVRARVRIGACVIIALS